MERRGDGGESGTEICGYMLKGCGITGAGEESQVVKRAAGFGGFRRRY